MSIVIAEKLKEGDLIYTNCSNFELCRHAGIVYFDGEKKMVYHNDPYMLNKWGGNVCCQSYSMFIKNRNVIQIVKTAAKNEDILRVARKCRSESYDTLTFNCEDFVLEIVEGCRRSDVRDAWKIAALGITILSII